MRSSDWSADVCSSDLSLLNFYRKLIRFRNESPALTYGDIVESGMHIEEVVSLIRIHQNEELLVLHHVSDVALTVELGDRKRVVLGKSVSVRVSLCGRRLIKKKT